MKEREQSALIGPIDKSVLRQDNERSPKWWQWRKKTFSGRLEKEYKYAGYFLILLVFISFAAFYKTYFADLPGFAEPIHLLIHVHVLVLSLWIFMLIAQPFLILYNKQQWHRRLGKLAYLVVPLVILTSIGMMYDVYYRGQLDNMTLLDNLRNLLFPFASNTMMIVFFALAMWSIKKKNFANHTRYMIGMAIIILDPTITRIALFWYDVPYPFVMTITYAIIDSVLLALILFDIWKGFNYRPYLLVAAFFVCFQALFYASFYF